MWGGWPGGWLDAVGGWVRRSDNISRLMPSQRSIGRQQKFLITQPCVRVCAWVVRVCMGRGGGGAGGGAGGQAWRVSGADQSLRRGGWGCRLRMGSSRSVPGRHPIYRQPAREASAPIVTPAARTPPQHPLSSGWCRCGAWASVGESGCGGGRVGGGEVDVGRGRGGGRGWGGRCAAQRVCLLPRP